MRQRSPARFQIPRRPLIRSPRRRRIPARPTEVMGRFLPVIPLPRHNLPNLAGLRLRSTCLVRCAWRLRPSSVPKLPVRRARYRLRRCCQQSGSVLTAEILPQSGARPQRPSMYLRGTRHGCTGAVSITPRPGNSGQTHKLTGIAGVVGVWRRICLLISIRAGMMSCAKLPPRLTVRQFECINIYALQAERWQDTLHALTLRQL